MVEGKRVTALLGVLGSLPSNLVRERRDYLISFQRGPVVFSTLLLVWAQTVPSASANYLHSSARSARRRVWLWAVLIDRYCQFL